MKKVLFVFVGVALMSCAAKRLTPGAELVRFAQQDPQGCKYLGEVTGNQGNSFSGSFTSNKAMETGARNDMKNKAYKMGGNVIVMLTNRAGTTGGGWSGYGATQTNVAMTAAVYQCPNQ